MRVCVALAALQARPLTSAGIIIFPCRYTFVASSVLIIYDGEPDSLGMSHEDVVRVKLIDFAQTTKAHECVMEIVMPFNSDDVLTWDDHDACRSLENNLLFGVRRLIEHLHLLLKAIKTRHVFPVFAQVEHLEQSYQ